MGGELAADIAVIGGGVGGCAAALAAARAGKTVVLTEETPWIGGQLTSQAVPPDEHRWIEQFGCTRSYRTFREGVRSYYRDHFPLTAEARAKPDLNPGNGGVSRLCHEPRTALAVLQQMLAPHVHSGRVTVLLRHGLRGAEADGDRVAAVTVGGLDTGREVVLRARCFLDATECGDLLPATGTEFVTGSESARETGEPHALAGDADPLDMQAVSWCFALDYLEGQDHTIGKPEQYGFWHEYKADFWPGRQLGWTTPWPWDHTPNRNSLFPVEGKNSCWLFRRILDKGNFLPGAYASDVTLVNWPMIDYWLGPLFGQGEEEARRHREAAKQLSLSFLYWMQTEAERFDGGCGFPGLRLRRDVVGTEDGLAMYPYIRESRRIRAEFTVLEQHVSADCRREPVAEKFPDSVGVGAYRLDLHPSTGGRNYVDMASLPFQIPLGSLIPVRMENLLPACKNIGTTHVTNGCYRLHPVEWNVGEAAGLLAAFCLDRGLAPRQARRGPMLADFQGLLAREGVELDWPRMGKL